MIQLSKKMLSKIWIELSSNFVLLSSQGGVGGAKEALIIS